MKTFQEFLLDESHPGDDELVDMSDHTPEKMHTIPAQRSSYDGPGKGQEMHKLSVDQHLKCMNYHADEGKKVAAGTARHSNTYTPTEKKKQMQIHHGMYLNHQEMIHRLGDVGNPHKD